MKPKTNAQRFIDAYNEIDYTLRVQHNLKRSTGFSDMIRKAVMVNFIVRKYEDDLIDYGRLRNAIIHRSNEKYIIAEPHTDVVEKIEQIARLLTKPPKALERVCTRNVLTVQHDVKIRDVIKLIASTNFSNIPVYKDGELIGIANGQKLLDCMGLFLIDNPDIKFFLDEVSIGEVINKITNNFYIVLSEGATIEDVLDSFYKSSKLLVVLITKTGSMNEAPLGIVTKSDVMTMNAILENY